MIAIKDRKMPKGCQHCRFFRRHTFGNGLDYSYSCDLGATEFPMPWIRQMEERASDCPLVEIEERKLDKIEQIVNEEMQIMESDLLWKIKEILNKE